MLLLSAASVAAVAAVAAVLALSPAQAWVLPSPPQQACQPAAAAALRRPSPAAASAGQGSWLLDPIRCRSSGGGRGAAAGGWARVGGRAGRLWAVDVDTETKEGGGDGASGGGGSSSAVTSTTTATTSAPPPRMPMTEAERLQLQAQMLKLQAEKLRLEAEREQIQARACVRAYLGCVG